MTSSELKIFKKLETVERLLKQDLKKPQWLTAEQVKTEFNLSKKFLQLKRKDGTIKKYRCLSGKKMATNFHYHRSEIESLFKTIKN